MYLLRATLFYIPPIPRPFNIQHHYPLAAPPPLPSTRLNVLLIYLYT